MRVWLWVIPACLVSVVWCVVAAIDVDRWQSGPLCDQLTTCTPPNRDPNCDDMDGVLRVLFGWYMVAFAAEGTKICVLLSYAMSCYHYRSVATTVAAGMWLFVAATNAASLGLTVYRYGIMALLLSEYQEDLHPTTTDAVWNPWMIAMSTLTTLSSSAISATALIIPLVRMPSSDRNPVYSPLPNEDTTGVEMATHGVHKPGSDKNEQEQEEDAESRAKIA